MSRRLGEKARSMRKKLKVASLRTIKHRTERTAEMEAENAALLAELSRYSHEREMNADVACALRQRDAVLKELAEQRARLDAYVNATEAYILRLRQIVYSGVDPVKSNAGMEITRLDLAGDVERAKAAIAALPEARP